MKPREGDIAICRYCDALITYGKDGEWHLGRHIEFIEFIKHEAFGTSEHSPKPGTITRKEAKP
jgi:hypothetical protein